jgi:hypothetical protein
MRAGQLQQASHELAHNQAERANLNHVSNLQTADQSKLANMESRVKLGEVLTAHDQKQLDDANLLHREARNYPMEQMRNFNEVTQNIPRPPKPTPPAPQQPSGWTNIAGGVGAIASQLRQDQINASNQKLHEEFARTKIDLMKQQLQAGAKPLKTGGRVYLKTGGIADQIMFKLKQANMPDPRVNQFDDMLKLREIEAKKQNISPNESFASNFFGSLAKSDPNEEFLQTIGKGLEAGHQGYKAQAEQNNAQYEKLSAIDSIMANTFSKIASDEDKMGLEREKLDLEREKIGALKDEKRMALDLRNQQQNEANRHRHISENKKILDLNNATLASAKKFMPVLDNAINALERMKQKGLKLGQVGQQTAHNISTHLSSAIANRSPFGAFDQESRDLMDMFDSSIRSYLQMRASDLGGSRLTNALLQTLAKDKPDFSKGYDANLEILLHQRDLLNQASEEAKFVNQAIHEGMNPEEAYALLDRQMETQKTNNGRISTQEHVERILSMSPDEVRNYKKTLSKEELEAVKAAIKSGRGN